MVYFVAMLHLWGSPAEEPAAAGSPEEAAAAAARPGPPAAAAEEEETLGDKPHIEGPPAGDTHEFVMLPATSRSASSSSSAVGGTRHTRAAAERETAAAARQDEETPDWGIPKDAEACAALLLRETTRCMEGLITSCCLRKRRGTFPCLERDRDTSSSSSSSISSSSSSSSGGGRLHDAGNAY